MDDNRQPSGQGGRSARLVLRLSFQQYLLLAFLLIAGLLGTSSLRALYSLEQLMVQSRHGVTQASLLSTLSQTLNQHSQSMERAARQSLVLRDRDLRQSFTALAAESTAMMAQLTHSGVDTQLDSEWSHHLQAIDRLLDAPLDRAFDNERLVAAEFEQLQALHSRIDHKVQALNTQRSQDLLTRVEDSRHRITRQVVAVIVLALVLALALGIGLGRPFKRLEMAIQHMGENRLNQPIVISGPDDVRRVGQQLEWLRLRLLELDADKARFLRHVSHELKTPLAAVREGAALLRDEVTGPLSAGQREVVNILQQNTRSLQSEIEALLHFNAAAFAASQLQRQATSLRPLIEAQILAQHLQWQARRLKVDLQCPPLVVPVDAEKLGAALSNLLSNAIRFSPLDGHISITVVPYQESIHIDVQDQGPGVAPSDREHVFEPFYRGTRQPDDAVRGSGIGLSIVQEYVHAHGGRALLVVEGEHTFFRLELPYAS